MSSVLGNCLARWISQGTKFAEGVGVLLMRTDRLHSTLNGTITDNISEILRYVCS